MIESVRKEKQSLLILDCGAVFGSPADRTNAELHLMAMEKMGYDALNLAAPELSLGKAFLERSRSLVSFPYVASNLFYEGGRLPWIREYVIKEVGGIKVAILGVLDPEDFKKIPKRDDLKGFEVVPPKTALERLLPEVKGQADLIVLLSQLGDTSQIKTLALGESVEGIDIAIFSEQNYLAAPPHKFISIHTGTEGQTMGLATVTLDDKGHYGASERKYVQMGLEVSENREMLGLTEAYKRETGKRN